MKIYFAGSITAGRQLADRYEKIIAMLEKHGEVLTEHIGYSELSQDGEPIPPEVVNSRDLEWLHDSEVLVADLSVPSLGVGYEIGKAEEWGKKILLLSGRPDPSPMIIGSPYGTLRFYEDVSEVEAIFEEFFASL